MPKTINFEGTTHTFPDDFTDQDIQKSLNAYSQAHKSAIPRVSTSQPSMTGGESFGQTLSNMVPAAAATGGELVGGPVGGVLGGIGGALLKQAIQPKEPSADQFAVDVGLNSILPSFIRKLPFANSIASKILGKLANADNPAIVDYIADKAGTFRGSQAETAARIGGDVSTALQKEIPGITQKVPVYGKGSTIVTPGGIPASQTIIGHKIETLPEVDKSVLGNFAEIPALQKGVENESITKAVDKAFGDVTQIRNLKILANPTDVEQLGLQRAMNKGFSSDGKINPDAILTELNGKSKDVYDEAISPVAKQNLTDFLSEVKKLQPSSEKGAIPGMINYARRRLVFDLTAGIGGHLLGGGVLGAGTGIILSEGVLSKFASSPLAGRLAIQALQETPGSPQAQLISKVLVHSLRGSSILLQLPDGKTQPAVVDQQGNVVPQKTQ